MSEYSGNWVEAIAGVVTAITAVVAAAIAGNEYRKARARERREVAFEFLRRLREDPALRLGTIF